MRRNLILTGIVLALAATLTGCAKKTETATTETSSDSLLSSNPVEQPQGNLTPSQTYQGNQNPVNPPAPAPSSTAPRHTRTSTPSRPRHSSDNNTNPSSTPEPEARGVTLSAGTPVQVAVSTAITTKTAQTGDTWSGEVKENVIVGNTVVIPAGSTVSGVVNAAQAAKSGSLASLDIAVTSISINGTSHAISAATEPIVAGSTRARNLGAMAGGAAAGALIGRAVGGGKGTLIGGLIGAVGAGAGVAASKGYQVTVKEGTVITFTVSAPVTVKS